MAVSVKNFVSRTVYRSEKRPGYAAWASFFPGHGGRWHISFLELQQTDSVIKRSPREFYYQMGIAGGMDDTRMIHDIVIMETEDLIEWKDISHDMSHHREAFGDFAQAYTKNGNFIRFIWRGYSCEQDRDPGEILYISYDKGITWEKKGSFHDRRFISYPHRLRMLRDGTLVLALPMSLDFSKEKPRTSTDLDAESEMRMNLCFSFDNGENWTQPLPIYGSRNVSETDFAEMPSGDLLCVNSSIPHFGHPGRQIIYRDGRRFTAGPYEKARKWETCVPETIALAESGILIGCMRPGHYAWSDDLGLTWSDLNGFPDLSSGHGEVYQPWINYLGDGRFACAGHYGNDDVFSKEYDNYIALHLFGIEAGDMPETAEIFIEREYDESGMAWTNKYFVHLSCGGKPIKGGEAVLWWVRMGEPGGRPEEIYGPLDERIKLGGVILRSVTDGNGIAEFILPAAEMDAARHWTEDLNDYLYMTAWFNRDGRDKRYKPAQSRQYGFYARSVYEPGSNPD